MKKLAIVILLMLLAFPVMASVRLQSEGEDVGMVGYINITGDATTTLSDGMIGTIDIIGGASSDIEVVTASNDTVTTADDGTIFVYTNTSDNKTITLPTAAAGLEFGFVDGGCASTTISIDPASTADTIKYLNLDAGDKLTSSGATGDSVTLAGASGAWYVIGMGSEAWTDGG